MNKDTQRRGILYGVAIGAASILLFLGFGLTLPPDLGTRLSGAALLAGAGDYDNALAEIERGIDEHPEHLDGYVFRAAILGAAQRYDESIDAYDKALQHENATGAMRRQIVQDRASVLLQVDRLDEFRAARDELAVEGVDQYVHTLDALLAAHRKEWATAIRHWEEVVKADDTPQFRSLLWDALLRQGRNDIVEGRYEQAEARFVRAGELIPGDPDPFLKGGEVRLAEDDPKGALAILNGCPPDAPGLAPLLFRCATELRAKGEPDLAWASISRAIRADKEATRVLLEQDPGWSELRESDRMRSLLAKHDTQE